MAHMMALLQSDPALLPCVLHRLDPGVDLGVQPGRAVGLGYFENGQVLLRKRPAPASARTLGPLASGVQSEALIASVHPVGAGVFVESDTPPYRFRTWMFAGIGRVVPLGERASVLASLPDFLRRGIGGGSDGELAFFVTLGHLMAEARSLDRIDLEPELAAHALARTLAELDERAAASSAPLPETCAVISNGRLLAAVRQGRPLFYALIEGLQSCEMCGLEQGGESDARARAHRQLRGVVLSTRPVSGGLSWLEVPDRHLLTVSRSLQIRLTSLG